MMRSLRVILSFLVMFTVVLSFWGVVFADMGPKPSISIVVRNPPADVYYLDLLVHSDAPLMDGQGYDYLHDRDQLDPAKLALLTTYGTDGWYAAMARGTTMPIWGDVIGQPESTLTGRSQMVHTFSYMVPADFKFIIVTPDNQLIVSEVFHREILNTVIYYDYASGQISRPSLYLNWLYHFLYTFLPTLLIEGLILLLFGFSLRQNGLVFLLTNLATQVLLTLTMGTLLISQGSFVYVLLFGPAELVVLIIEAIVYALLFKQHSRTRRVVYAIVANIVSAVAGLVIPLVIVV